MAEERETNCNTTTIKLLITSTDCDPKAELPFSDHTPVQWNDIVDALIHAKYCFAMRRLTPPSNLTISNNPKIRNFRTRLAILSLRASKKVAFLYSNDFVKANYEITYDKSLMNDLPSFCDLKGLPRFHLFTSLPEDLQLKVVELLDGVGFARMRCVSRHFSRLKWSRNFNILKYSHPDVNKQPTVNVEELKKGEYFLDNAFLLRFASAVCFVAVAYVVVNKVRSGVCADDYDEEEYE